MKLLSFKIPIIFKFKEILNFKMTKAFDFKNAKILNLNKRGKFVISVLVLSSGVFVSEFFSGGSSLIIFSLLLATLTDILLFFILKEDIKKTFFLPILVLPFIYTLAFSLFYSVIPVRLLTRFLLTGLYGFGLYSLFLTQNIFAVSSIRTINLLRSARIVSFVLTIVVLFLIINVSFALRPPFYVLSMLVFGWSFLLNFQSIWAYSLDKSFIYETFLSSILISFSLSELSLVLSIWPVDASIFSIFLTGIFYAYSGLSHAWFERRLFKGVLWEYVWVGFLAILILFIFSNWGI